MNILNGNEAFAALMAGKKLMCRAVGGLIEFDDLDQFPATIFAMPGYEFSIKIDLIELAGITFTKPLTLDEIQEGQDVFSITTHNPGIYISEFGRMTTAALIHSINSGFVQRDEKNAKLQLQAMCKAFGRELDGDCLVVRLGEDPNKPEKKRQSRKKTTDTSVTIADVEPLGVESEDTPWEVDTATKLKTKHASTVDDVEAIEEDPIKIVEKFTAQINACTTAGSVLELRHSFAANGHLDDTHVHHLMKLVEDKCLELDPEQYTPKIEIISQENVTTSEDSLILKVENTLEITDFNKPSAIDLINAQAEKAALKESVGDCGGTPIDLLYKKTKEVLISHIYDMDSIDALERLAPAISAAKLKPEDHQELLAIYAERKTTLEHVEPDPEHQEHLNAILDAVANAQTPIQVNAQIRYTKTWNEHQRKPVIQAMNKRLIELNDQKEVATEPPSLMVQIQNTQNQHELNELLPEIRSRHPDIQPKLMDLVKKRRFELENQGSQVAS